MAKYVFILAICYSFGSYGQVLCQLSFYKLHNKSDYEFISRVYEFAKRAHKGVTRKLEGKPYIVHPDRVAQNVLRYTQDKDIIAAALLHDVVEDTSISIKVIELTFNKRVASFVNELTSDHLGLKKLGKTNYLIKKLNSISDEALLIKLLDRKDNLSDLPLAGKEFQRKYPKSTEEILSSLDRKLKPFHKKVISEIRELIAPYVNK